jgi:WD40 repeat protein
MPALRVQLALLVLIACSAPAAGETDRHGDPLPTGAIGRFGTTRLRHGSAIRALAFLPDGKTVASVDGGLPGASALWDAATGKERAYHRIDWGELFAAALTPDGRLVGATDGKQLTIYDLASGKLLARHGSGRNRDGRGSYIPICFCGSARIVAAATADRDRVDLWDVAADQLLQSLDLRQPKGPGYTSRLVPSPDGKLLATVSGGDDRRPYDVAVWDIATGKQRYLCAP